MKMPPENPGRFIIPSLIAIDTDAESSVARFSMKFARAHSTSGTIKVHGFVFPSDRGLYLLGIEENPLPQGHVALFLDDIGRGDSNLLAGIFVRRYSNGSHFASRICLRGTEFQKIEDYNKSPDAIDLFSNPKGLDDEILDMMDNYVIYDGKDVLVANDHRRRVFKKEWKMVKRGQ